MNATAKRLLYWTLRAICIAFAAFMSIFAMDVFQAGVPVWKIALTLLMHLLPTTFLMIAVLILCWRREWLGGAPFIALGVLYVVDARNKPFFGWDAFLLISGPLLLVGALFLLGWRYRAQLRGA